jgi:hypothetical protein
MKNLAFYTVFTGGNGNPSRTIPPTQPGFDNYFFTDNQDLYNDLGRTKWTPIFINEKCVDDLVSSAMASKPLKANPFLTDILAKYDYTCYHDSRLLNINLTKVMQIIGDQSFSFAMRIHPFLAPKVYDEFNESMMQARYVTQREQILKYIAMMETNGLAIETSSHVATGFIIRNMKHPETKSICETWLEHIKQCGIQCQISMFFVKQLFDSACFRILHDSEVF